MRIDFIHQNIYGVGGTVRSVINLANALAEDHQVRIVSVFRRVERASIKIDPRIRLVPLIDLRPDGVDRGDPRHNRRSNLVPPAEEYFRQYSELTDDRIVEYLSGSRSDVVVGTRPSLNLLVARHTRTGVVCIAQEHMSHGAIPDTVVRAMRASYGRIDLVTTVTEADRRRVAESLGRPPGSTAVLPNSVPTPETAPADGNARSLIAAGRLAPEKRYDSLLRAMAEISPKFPDWNLRLYGDGPLRGRLASLADELGVADVVYFMGRTTDMESEWVKGSISVSTSDRESFGMSIVESMRAGVPVVSTDCPDGPREIISDGTDGVLVPTDDVCALADALSALMSSDSERAEMGEAARLATNRYDPARVAAEFSSLLGEVSPGLRRKGLARRWTDRWYRRHSRVHGDDVPERASVRVVMEDPGHVWIRIPGFVKYAERAEFRSVGRRAVPLAEIAVTKNGDAILAETAALPEGLWNLQLRVGDREVILNPASIDTRVLSRVGSSEDAVGFRWSIPYRNMHGRLGFRVWKRECHAEMLRVTANSDSLHVTVALLGNWPAEPIRWVAHRPGGARVESGGLDIVEGGVEFSISASEFARMRMRRDDLFHLSLLSASGEEISISRLSGDIADARKIVKLPYISVVDRPEGSLFHEAGHLGDVDVAGVIAAENALAIRVVER